MDSYLVVSGAPNSNQLHAENMLNLAIGLVYSGRTVIAPVLELPIRVATFLSEYGC